MRITIKDVAKKTGFSKSTVSRVLMGNPNVSEKTREQITQALEDMRYSRNEIARSMVAGSIKIILVIVGDILNLFYARSIRILEKLLYEAGYMTVVCNSEFNNNKEYRYIQMAKEFRFAGVILMTPIETKQLLDAIGEMECPVVLLNRYLKKQNLDTVVIDNLKGGEIATNYLIKHGHTEILHLSGPKNSSAAREREQGFKNAMQHAGLAVEKDMILTGDLTRASGERLAKKLLSSPDRFTAVFITNDEMCFGFLQEWTRMGKRVPDHISVISFDHSYLLESFSFGITTVGKDSEEMGKDAARILIERIENPSAPAQRIVYQPDIQERRSVQNAAWGAVEM